MKVKVPTGLVHESTAIAIVKGWVREGHSLVQAESNGLYKKRFCKGRKHNIQHLITPLLDKMDPILIGRTDKSLKKKRTTQAEQAIIFSYVTPFQEGKFDGLRNDKKYVSLMISEYCTKTMIRTDFFGCFITEHFLARLLQRTPADNFDSLKRELISLATIMEELLRRCWSPKRDIVILTVDGVFIFDSIKVDFCHYLVVKTVIPTSKMYGKTLKVYELFKAKLNEGECMILTKEKYEELKL